MEAETAQPPSGSAGPSSAAYPRWVMLEKYCNINVGDSSCSAADAKTLEAARTSIGDLIQFSLHLAEPLAALRICIQAPDGADVVGQRYTVVAAHGDSLLVQVEERNDEYATTDYFVYNAGDAAADPPRPPSLSLLPPCHIFDPTREDEEPVPRLLDPDATGLQRRGEDELVVVELSTVKVMVRDKKKKATTKVAELCLFRSGQWSVMRPPISYGNTGGDWQLPPVWSTVVPVGDRKLCWVPHFTHDVVICDVFEDSPRLQYLRLPMDHSLGQPSKWNWNLSATADGHALKFINIFRRCCCGGVGASSCKGSRHAYIIHTWTLRMDGGGTEWVKDGIVDASELWSLDAYKGLPRVRLDLPVMSMDEHEPHVVYFQLCERHHVKSGGDDTLWLLKVDTRSKTIQLVSRREDYKLLHTLIPSNVLHFFNSNRPSNAAIQVVDDEQLVREDDASNPTEQASEFLEVFLEISRYALGDDEVKAYRILSHDNGRRFRSLLRLPKNLRKDWLLMEIKASQAY